MTYEVAVPSHARATLISKRTLTTLANGGVPKDKVRVFVAAEERHDYRRYMDEGLYGSIEEGAISLCSQRNLIARFYPEGTHVVQADDDLNAVHRRIDEKHHEPVVNLQRAVFDRGFDACVEHGAGLWGVYPVLNALFMKPKVRVGLWYCLGQLWGVINSHAPELQLELSQKEDYERTLRSFDHYGKVIRLDDVACKSRMYADGGMQATDQPDRRKLNDAAVRLLQARWPNNVKIAKRESAHVGLEVRLVEPRV